MKRRVEARTGFGFELRRGQALRIVDLEGEQVADLYCVALGDPGERLSSGRSFDYNGTLYLTTGHVLYSNASRPSSWIDRSIYIECRSPFLRRLG